MVSQWPLRFYSLFQLYFTELFSSIFRYWEILALGQSSIQLSVWTLAIVVLLF